MPKNSTQLELFPTCLHLERVDTARNMRRFYRMTIERDLFGGTSLVRVWGRIGTYGRRQVNHHANEGLAVHALVEFAHKKRRRGYRVNVTSTTDDQ